MQKIIWIILSVFVCASYALAQNESPTTISGIVTDVFGSQISGVEIMFKARNGKTFTIASNSGGEYQTSLESGIYSLKFVKAPFKTFEIPEYQILWNSKMRLDVSLICEDCILIDDDLSALPQQAENLKDGSVLPKAKERRSNRKVAKGDNVPNEIKSPFRYVIVGDDLQFDEGDDVKGEVPIFRVVTVLMDSQAFNKANLIYLFKYLSDYYSEPTGLEIIVHTSLMTLETPEERAAMSTRSGRDRFRENHKMANYSRSTEIYDSIYEGCSGGFLYDTGKPGHFVTKFVNLPCTVKK
ncbi:MAG TPA: carboxypeptidase-like regulatory domain-containing protein [Pyrinomonadaceae bacterium]|nr:carboxypeptidase-like regulatory domain-containing protein [Pyrinomonadaceae bacterium]